MTRVRHRGEDRPIDGLLLVDKPAGVTSHDVVTAARRALGTRRIGHAGTLDPFATGLLVLLVGHATRLVSHMDGEPKVYEARVAFGAETDTDDVTGVVTRSAESPDPAQVRSAIATLTGEIEQIPPAYSAKQVDGQRAYAAARRGRPLELAPVRVRVHGWKVNELTAGYIDATVTCSGGTYIRALARDLGRLSSSAAHLATLRRTRSGRFDVAQAVTLEGLRGGLVTLQQSREAVAHLPPVTLSADEVIRVRHGQALAANDVGNVGDATAALVDGHGALVAIAERVDSSWRPRVVLPDA